MRKIHLVIGTRPDAIKMAPVYKALKAKQGLDVKLISTGQHKELLDQVCHSFGLVPDVDLKLMRPKQSLSQLTVGLLQGLEKLYQKDCPDLVLAHGDTTTCYGTALSAFYHSIPFFHVEAGLRTYRIDSPFPEEFNRQSVAHLSHHHFAPTEREKMNLLKDGILEKAITITGGTIHDAIADMQSLKQKSVYGHDHQQVVVFTLHRREHANQLQEMMNAIKGAATIKRDVLFVCPLHPNPIVMATAKEVFKDMNNVMLVDPLIYPDFLNLLARSNLILTDSGGIQEEASYLGKRTLLLRDSTERLDGLASGLTHVIGNNPSVIQESILKHLGLDFNSHELKSEQNKRASDIVADVVLEQCYA